MAHNSNSTGTVPQSASRPAGLVISPAGLAAVLSSRFILGVVVHRRKRLAKEAQTAELTSAEVVKDLAVVLIGRRAVLLQVRGATPTCCAPSHTNCSCIGHRMQMLVPPAALQQDAKMRPISASMKSPDRACICHVLQI